MGGGTPEDYYPHNDECTGDFRCQNFPKDRSSEHHHHSYEVMYSGNAGHDKRTLGINGLMKAYHGKKQLAGGWNEDLDNCLSV